MTKHHVIYIPGILDDAYHHGLLMKTWALYGLCGHTRPTPWAGSGPYQEKLDGLLVQIDKFLACGDKVSLVGASAGASGALNAYVQRTDKITGVILVCPKINGPETVSNKTYAHNPAFKTSLYALQDNLKKLTPKDKAKIRTYYSPTDQVIPYPAVPIPGVQEVKLPSLRHGQAIIYSISLGAPKLARYLKSLP